MTTTTERLRGTPEEVADAVIERLSRFLSGVNGVGDLLSSAEGEVLGLIDPDGPDDSMFADLEADPTERIKDEILDYLRVCTVAYLRRADVRLRLIGADLGHAELPDAATAALDELVAAR